MTDAEYLSFQQPTGKYLVGLRVYHWERELDLPKKSPSKYSAPSNANAPLKQRRPLTVSIWYPIDHGGDSQLNNEDVTTFPDSDTVKSHVEQSISWEKFTRVKSSSHVDAIPANLNLESTPLLIYSHGIGMSRTSGIIWCEELASHGFFVAAVEHFEFSASHECHFEREKILSMPMMEIRNIYHQDIKYILELLETKCWLDDLSLLIDLNNIGIFGHSVGGGAAWQLLWQDVRFKAAVSMDGFLTNRVFPKVNEYLKKPLLIFVSERPDAREEPDFFPGECGPGHEMTEVDFNHFIHSIGTTPIDSHIRVSSKFPLSNVTNVTIPHSGHFSFTSRILFKDYIQDIPSDQAETDTSESATEDVSDCSELNEARPPTIWDIVGCGNRNLNTNEFIAFVRKVIVVFFEFHLTR